MKIGENNHLITYIIFISFLAIITGIIYQLTPLYIDDLWYRRPLASCEQSMQALSATTAETLRHWTFDTGRLANLIAPPFLALLPRFIFSIASAAMLWITLFLSFRISRATPTDITAYLLAAAIIIVLPWFDFSYAIIYGLNYLWSSALAIATIYFVIAITENEQQYSPAKMALICLTALIAGWMHEGFSIPLAAGFLAYLAVIHKDLSRQLLILAISFALGISLIFTSPSIWQRVALGSPIIARSTLLSHILYVLVFNCLAIIYITLFVCTAVVRKSRNKWQKNEFATLLMLFTACIVSTAISYKFYLGPRTGWFSQLIGAVGIAYIMHVKQTHISKKIRATLIAIVAAIPIINLTAASVKQAELSKEYYQILSLYKSSLNGQVYFDQAKPQLGLDLFKTSVRGFNERIPLRNFAEYYSTDGREFTLLPFSLKDYADSFAKATQSSPSIKIYNGNFVMSNDELRDINTVTVVYADGTSVASRFYLTPFTDNAGIKHTLVQPLSSIFCNKRQIDIKL